VRGPVADLVNRLAPNNALTGGRCDEPGFATGEGARTFSVRVGGGFSYPPVQLRRDKSRAPARVADPCSVVATGDGPRGTR
jgi:hypothetical protein